MPERVVASAQADSPLQQQGYVRCYRAIMEACGMAAACLYGILEDYAQLGERTGRGAIPSHTELAKKMGCSVRSVKTYLDCLRTSGWLTWDTENGKPCRYTLTNLCKNCPGTSAKIADPPLQNLQTTSANFADNLEQVSNQRNLERSNDRQTPSPYALFSVICEASGQDIHAYTERDKGKHLAVAKRLIGDGVTEHEARELVAYLRSQRWRTTAITTFTVEKELSTWRAQGSPGQGTGKARLDEYVAIVRGQ